MEAIPLYSICQVHEADNDSIVVTDLKHYLRSHTRLVFPHRHLFYQILYITQEGGSHIIEFEKYPARKGVAFFLAPGQIHEWNFNKNTQGVLINMGRSFFSTFLAKRDFLDQLPFFSPNGLYPVVDFSGNQEVYALFDAMLAEFRDEQETRDEMLRALLLQLFVLASRNLKAHHVKAPGSPLHYRLFVAYEKLIDQYFKQKRLPKEYAEMLNITPNYLNALCIRETGRQAGELIRARILLESKRLLAHSDLSVSEIAWQLSFGCNSYFSRFFKKYEGVTPETFRKNSL